MILAEQLIKTSQGVTYRAKGRACFLDCEKNGLVCENMAQTYPYKCLPRQYAPVEDGRGTGVKTTDTDNQGN